MNRELPLLPFANFRTEGAKRILRNGLIALMAIGVCSQGWGIQMGKAIDTNRDGKLLYEVDEMGNRIPDFSSAGYGGGGTVLPQARVKIVVQPVDGDDGPRIQSAIDYVSGLPPGPTGMRGTVQLTEGLFTIQDSLLIEADGVCLVGAGDDPCGTRIMATGTDRRTLIRVSGHPEDVDVEAIAVIDSYVPVGADRLTIRNTEGLTVGTRIRIRRPSPATWIQSIGMDTAPARTHYAWKEGKFDVTWERTVKEIKGRVLLLDAPLTVALEAPLGGATVQRINEDKRVRNVGIGNFRCISESSSENPRDEDHSWMAIHLDHVEHAWVANVTGRGFASSLVYLGSDTRWITVQDCHSIDPVSELGGYRRQAFRVDGQQALFLRCTSENGINDFTAGYLAAGPNVFLECEAIQSSGMSGSIGSWASGLLFDNVHIDGGSLALDNLEVQFGGVGWAAANSVLWQSTASRVICRSPPGAQNYAIGTWGQFWGGGRWQASNEFVHPQSLYRVQLAERLGSEALLNLQPVTFGERKFPLELSYEALGNDVAPVPSGTPVKDGMRLENGWLVDDNGLMGGGSMPISWWRGHLIPDRTIEHNPSITRFLPGRTGLGATDDLEALAIEMERSGISIIRHHWGLWYDRRREDHEMIRRDTATVWPPFYEQPWARSGQGTAWDGLSKYDLTRFNPWYFKRLKRFSGYAAEHGRVLVNEMYFQHNIIESGAHWVDFPWRPVNAIQETGFPEPPPFEGDTIKMADAFYDVSHPVRRELHRAYIRQCLDNLSGESNVLHTVGAEYTGPLHFVEFWIDVVKEWIQETGHDPLIALSVTKDVQDAILSDPERSAVIDVIELKYWWYSGEQTYAPDGGLSLAPRQHLRKWKGGRPDASDIARMTREYRERYPGKAVIIPVNSAQQAWAALAGGASLVDPGKYREISQAGSALQVICPDTNPANGTWIVGVPGEKYLLWVAPGIQASLDLSPVTGRFRIRELSSGKLIGTVDGGKWVKIGKRSKSGNAYWVDSMKEGTD